jgi:hypothetical protein
VKQIHLIFQKKKLSLKTECSDEIIDLIEKYISENYLKHNFNKNLSELEISNILLVNAVHDILSLKKEKESNNERIDKILSRLG